MRCKCCDRPMTQGEIIYYHQEERFEEYCKRCRDQVMIDMQQAGWDIEKSHIYVGSEKELEIVEEALKSETEER